VGVRLRIGASSSIGRVRRCRLDGLRWNQG
jgi:hypothetical protein